MQIVTPSQMRSKTTPAAERLINAINSYLHYCRLSAEGIIEFNLRMVDEQSYPTDGDLAVISSTFESAGWGVMLITTSTRCGEREGVFSIRLRAQ